LADRARCDRRRHGACGIGVAYENACAATGGHVTAGIEVVGADTLDEAVSAQARVSIRGLVLVTPRALKDVSYVLLALFGVLSVYLDMRWAVANDAFAFDFAGTLWDPAIAVLDGRSPYPAPLVSEVDIGNPGYYPPLLMLLVAPLTFVPWAVGAAIWTALLAGALVGTLYLLRVRDLRCYALMLISAPAVYGLIWANATLLLLPLVALAWRWRERWLRSGALVGLAIAVKLFLWPLLFWQLGTRRYRALGMAVAVAAAGVLVPWALIGFDGLASYPDLLRVAQEIYSLHGYSVATILGALGVETETATWGGLVLGGAIAVLAFAAGRRHHDEVSLSLALFAALIASPIVWEHYFALLLIPLAIARPRFSALWMILPLFYLPRSLPSPLLQPGDLDPGGAACCPPDGFPLSSWAISHAPPALWPALGHVLLAGIVIGLSAWAMTHRRTA